MKEDKIYVHLYFNPYEVNQFIDGEIRFLNGFTKETKSPRDIVQLSIPLGKVDFREDGNVVLDRELFKEEF